ncbi:MAG: HlyD family efflux transporter periplasmic adaptor subunit [Betaproteobacteria bacterium]|nr:HlyD family efflux transporter periplasmic adaptor subunit [Betaproteobacteria bacterium]
MAVTASVFSSLWYRVSALRPGIADRVRIERQPCRGEVWHLLIDPRNGRSLRLNRSAYAIAGRLTATHSVQQVWDAACAELGDDAPTQDECIGILAQLHERGLLQCERSADFDAAYRQYQEQSARSRAPARNPLAFRIPLGDPTRLLAALAPLGQWLFRWPVLLLWTACVGVGVALAAAHWDALFAHAAKWLATPRYILIALVLYPIIKAVHELAHGLAIRRWGGAVPAWGITLLVAMPVPFVDGSAAVALPKARQRVLTSAAGIMAELWIAALGLAAWLALEPGLGRDIAFVAAFIGAISTLLFNANPLIRFDGYHALTDALQLPNLAGRSARYWLERMQAALLRLPPAEPIVAARGERVWLELYAPLSWLYRIGLACAIVLWAGTYSFVLGTLLLALVGAQLLSAPLRLLRNAFGPSAPGRAAGFRAAVALAVSVSAFVALLTLVPMPFAAVAQGVVWVPEDAQVRAHADGFVVATPVRDGAQVGAGDIVMELRNPALVAAAVRLRARIGALETEHFRALRTDANKAQDAAEALAQARAELERAEERIDALRVRAQVAGRLVMPWQSDLEGTYVRKGELLGQVLADQGRIVRVAVPQDEAAPLKAHTRTVTAQLAGNLGAPVRAQLERDSHAAGKRLPSAALSTRNGGTILTDPDAEDESTPLDAVVVLDVRLPADVASGRAGERAWVRFDFGAAPLAQQWGRRLRQALLRHFNPGG